MAVDFARIRAVFEAAIDLPIERRSAFVAAECGADDRLRTEVGQLLASDASNTPLARAIDGTAEQLARPSDPLLGTTIANFRLGAVLGSGGMGTVFAAEQQEPRRSVALKVLTLGLASPAAVARFRWEAELLARLRHPGIAQIYAAGLHRCGDVELPWFALELVPGAEDLTAHAAARKLSTAARLELLLQVCDAVQHGHLQGVVHRDLKPQNVLVDVDGRVKVIDFGIARSTVSDADAPPTERGILLGTLAYMSPEQLAGDTIDHRTDVWAVAVLAFELLAGRRPFDLTGLPPWRAAEVVQTTPAPRLSSCLPGAPRDLDAVLGKALRLAPTDRYESVAAFAADLRAVLEARPVHARPASAFYHARLFARRRRGTVAALAAIAATIVVAVIALATQNVALQRQQRQSARVAGFAREFLGLADVTMDRGVDYTVREALDVAARGLASETFAEPLVEAELRLLVGDAYRGLSLPTTALPHLHRAVELYRAELGPDDRQTIAAESSWALTHVDLEHLEVAEGAFTELVRRTAAALPSDDPVALRVLHDQAYLWRSCGRLHDAEQRYRAVLAARERTLGRTAAATIVTQHNLGTLLLAKHEPAAAHEVLRDCLDRSRAAGEARTSTWQIADNLAEALRDLGQLEAAAAMHRESMDGFARLLGPDHALTLGCGYHLLKVLHRSGDRVGMRALVLDLLPRCERTFGPDHRRTMGVLAAAALVRLQDGDTAGALGDFTRAFTVQQQTLGAAHPDTFLAGQNLAQTQLTVGDAAAALKTTTVLTAQLPRATDVPPVSVHYTRLLHAKALAGTGDRVGAAASATDARDGLRALFAEDHPLLQQASALAAELAAAGSGG